MNRCGKVYTVGLLVLYVLSALTALIYLEIQYAGVLPEDGIGAHPAALLAAYDRMDRKLLYLEEAGRLAVDEAVTLLYEDQTRFFTFTTGDGADALPCGQFAYQVWNGSCLLDDAENLVRTALAPRILEGLGRRTQAYPAGGFSVGFEASVGRRILFTTTEELEEPVLIGQGTAAPRTSVEGLTWPSDTFGLVTSCFGPRPGVAAAASDTHAGMDLPAAGKAIAAADGVVMNDVQATNYGTLWIKHSDDLATAYLHLDKGSVRLKPGDVVQRGQEIGRPSDTGCADRGCPPHLHFEVLVRTVPSGNTAHAYESAYAPGWWRVNPVCFFDGLTKDMFSSQATQSCFHRDYPQPPQEAYCGEYGLVVGPAQSYQAGTAGNSLPGAGGDAVRPSNLCLDSQQQAKFSATQVNLQRYRWLDHVIAAAGQHAEVSEALLLGILTQESLGDPNAISHTGCVGLMQLCYSTAIGTQYYEPRDLTICGYSCAPNCPCGPGNDGRFDPRTNILAGAEAFEQKRRQFTSYTDALRFAIAAYNVGEGVVKNAIAGTGDPDPSWEEVIRHLERHPELITYNARRSDQVRKVEEVMGYVPNVTAYGAAWQGCTPLTDAGGYVLTGKARQVGTYHENPSFALDVPVAIEPFLVTAMSARQILNVCGIAPDPLACLDDAAGMSGWERRCEDPGPQYVIDLYAALRGCAGSGMDACTCPLPSPPVLAQPLVFRIDAVTGDAVLDGHPELGFPDITDVTLRTLTDVEVVPAELVLTLTDTAALSFTERVAQGVAAPVFEWDSWVAEKSGGHLVFRRQAEESAMCVPAERYRTYCAPTPAGTVKFALQVEDEVPPPPVGSLAYDPDARMVSFTASQGAAYYDVTMQPPPAPSLFTTASTSFDASPYVGTRLFITPFDAAGNAGVPRSVLIS